MIMNVLLLVYVPACIFSRKMRFLFSCRKRFDFSQIRARTEKVLRKMSLNYKKSNYQNLMTALSCTRRHTKTVYDILKVNTSPTFGFPKHFIKVQSKQQRQLFQSCYVNLTVNSIWKIIASLSKIYLASNALLWFELDGDIVQSIK